MPYLSLYRKYRPQSFTEVVGQEHVSRTLVNALAEDRLHHAYLFTGPRGTGKTSTARILAKAVNCESGPTPEPCQTCAQCRAIADGSSIDVVELDMASHGGVDDARELRERALLAPAAARRKVYILDEVHMASTAAFNALLKLLEEPPAHVLFAMATTDPQKVLPTITSRVQRLDLRRVSAQQLADHLRRIAALEGFTVSDEALAAVVRAGDGSVRDALSILDQVVSYTGGDVTAADVAKVLGHTPAERVFDVVTLIAAGDLAGLLALVQDLQDAGHDLRRFTLDLLSHLRDLIVLQVAPDRPDLVDATSERRSRLGAQAPLLPRDSCLRAVDLLAAALTDMRRGAARLALELALSKLAIPALAGDPAALADRVARLEARAVPPPPTAAPDPEEPTAGRELAATPPPDPSPPAAEEVSEAAEEVSEEMSLAGVLQRWGQVLDAVKTASIRLHAIIQSGTPIAVDGDTVVIGFRHRFHADEVGRAEQLQLVREALTHTYGRPLRARTAVMDGDGAPPPAVLEAGDENTAGLPFDLPAAVDSEAAERAAALLRERLGAEPVEG